MSTTAPPKLPIDIIGNLAENEVELRACSPKVPEAMVAGRQGEAGNGFASRVRKGVLMIKISNLTFTYRRDLPPLLEEISLELNQPGIVEIAGVSGSGKTTLIELINGIIPHIYPGIRKGTVSVDKKDPWLTPPEEIARSVSTVMQNYELQLLSEKVDDEVDLDHPLAEKLGLKRLKGRLIRELSSGEKQKVLIAKQLQKNTPAVILDEPFANLDSEGVNILREILSSSDKFLLVSSHLYHFEESRKFVIHKKRLIQATGDLRELGIRVTPYRFSIPKTSLNSVPPVLGLYDIHFSYRDNRVFKNLNLEIYPGTITGIYGKNGAGKTTLAKLIAGFLTPQSGKIFYRRKPVKKPLAGDKVGLVFQDPYAQVFGLTVRDEIRFDPGIRDRLEKLNLNLPDDFRILRLSRGELMRFAIAANSRFEIMIYDEPTSGLDYHSLKKFADFLASLKEEGRSIIVFSHDREFLRKVSDRLIKLTGGRLIAQE